MFLFMYLRTDTAFGYFDGRRESAVVWCVTWWILWCESLPTSELLHRRQHQLADREKRQQRLNEIVAVLTASLLY